MRSLGFSSSTTLHPLISRFPSPRRLETSSSRRGQAARGRAPEAPRGSSRCLLSTVKRVAEHFR